MDSFVMLLALRTQIVSDAVNDLAAHKSSLILP